jgi:hypothetical protein
MSQKIRIQRIKRKVNFEVGFTKMHFNFFTLLKKVLGTVISTLAFSDFQMYLYSEFKKHIVFLSESLQIKTIFKRSEAIMQTVRSVGRSESSWFA